LKQPFCGQEGKTGNRRVWRERERGEDGEGGRPEGIVEGKEALVHCSLAKTRVLEV